MTDFQPFPWRCPHCNHSQTVTSPHYSTDCRHVYVTKADWGYFEFCRNVIVCANEECQKPQITVSIYRDEARGNQFVNAHPLELLYSRVLIPEGSSKPQPEYIPQALREDYLEACKIRDLSPKASATLIRRCLQGMIRNFCGISKNRLVDEIAELRERVAAGTAPPGVSPESVDAIDNVRQVGNIGAHMEKDIDLIVPVDPGEAQLLIELVENLFDEWYVARHKRQERFSAIKAVADAKKTIKNNPPTNP